MCGSINNMRLFISFTLLLLAFPFVAPNYDSSTCSCGLKAARRQHTISIADFGAVGDGSTINTKSFRDAIAHIISLRGDVTLYIPSGRWLTGCFNLTSYMTLFLEQGAVILGSQDPQDWPVIDPLPSYGRGRELPGRRYGSLIHGQDLTDVVITGNNGTIDGQGSVWWNWFRKKTLKYTRGHLVELLNSTSILISDVTLLNSPFWTLHPVYCSNVLIQGVTILAPHDSPNTDGIDPDSSSDVCIKDCYISNGDDAIVIKSGWDEYGIAFGRPSTNIFIHNIIVAGSHGISLGSEMSGGISNVEAKDVVMYNAKQAIHIKTAGGRGAYIANVSFSNFEIHNTTVAISFTALYGDHPDNKYDPHAFSAVENIAISNIVADGVHLAGDFRGVPQSPFNNICFKNISVTSMTRKLPRWNCSYIHAYSEDVHPSPCSDLRSLSSCSPFPVKSSACSKTLRHL